MRGQTRSRRCCAQEGIAVIRLPRGRPGSRSVVQKQLEFNCDICSCTSVGTGENSSPRYFAVRVGLPAGRAHNLKEEAQQPRYGAESTGLPLLRDGKLVRMLRRWLPRTRRAITAKSATYILLNVGFVPSAICLSCTPWLRCSCARCLGIHSLRHSTSHSL